VDGDEFMKLQQDLFLALLDAVESAGTALAVPTQANILYPTAPLAAANSNGSGASQTPMVSNGEPIRK